MKLDFNFDLVNLNGTPVTGEEDGKNAGKLLANALSRNQGDNENFLKYFDWALAIYRGQVIEVDKSDFDKLRKFVNNHPQFFALVKAQLVRYMDGIKKAAEELENVKA